MDHTFIILAYKESRFLEDCIESLRRQTVRSHLVLSTSTPSRFLEECCERHHIPLAVSGSGGGLAADWTRAYQLCQTKYGTLAHQDDLYFPEYTSTFLSYMNPHKNALIAYSDYAELSGNSLRTWNMNLIVKKVLLLPHLWRSALRTSLWKKGILCFGSPICCPSVMYNKERIGEFEFNRAFEINPDWDAWFRLAEQEGAFVYVNKRLMAHRIYEGSETSKGIRNNRRRIEDEMIFGKIWPRPAGRLIARLYSLSYRSNLKGAL